MLAEQFTPLDIDCLVRTAVELWVHTTDTGGTSDLSNHQQTLLDRAHQAMDADDTDPVPTPPAMTTLARPRPPQARALARWDRNPNPETPRPAGDAAERDLTDNTSPPWHDSAGGPTAQPPTDDREATRRDSNPDQRSGDVRTLPPAAIATSALRRRTRPVTPDYQFPGQDDCDRANRAAIFYPMHGEDTLPCIEDAGIQVYAYLDHTKGAVRVISVHLDSVDERLVRPDNTVPLQVVCQDRVLFDDSSPLFATPDQDDESTETCDECGQPISLDTPSPFSAEHAEFLLAPPGQLPMTGNAGAAPPTMAPDDALTSARPEPGPFTTDDTMTRPGSRNGGTP